MPLELFALTDTTRETTLMAERSVAGLKGTPNRKRPLAHATLRRTRVPALVALSLLTFGCSSDRVTLGGSSIGISTGASSGPPAPGTPGVVSGFLGAVVSDDPRATLVGRDILSAGGTAGDAAIATGFALTVALPSRAGLGGGGACIAYSVGRKAINAGIPEAILFQPLAAASTGARVDRPAAVPMFARGMYLIHHRYGRLPFEALVQPAETIARTGIPASRAFTRDLAYVAAPLFADPGARAIFGQNGQPLAEGQLLRQPDLGGTLAQIRVAGVGDFYQGATARRIEEAAPHIGATVGLSDLRGALPQLAGPIFATQGNDRIAFLPSPVDPGLTANAFRTLQANPAAAPDTDQRALPASTTFAAMDKDGNAVVCAVTLNNLFGTGRILPGLGFLAAASPTSVPTPILSVGLAWNEREQAFRAAVGGSGQGGAPNATALAMLNTLRTGQPMAAQVADPGRANVIACSRYLPGAEKSCAWASDPRESGLAAGGGG